jgi:hypothetical protein
MITINVAEETSDFAENKDIARKLRIDTLEPAIENKEKVVIDFNGVLSATQSFIHALISEVIRKWGIDSLDQIMFKNCNEQIKTIVNIVVDYVQDGIFSEPQE